MKVELQKVPVGWLLEHPPLCTSQEEGGTNTIPTRPVSRDVDVYSTTAYRQRKDLTRRAIE